MRKYIDIVEARDAIFGVGLWVSPEGEVLHVGGDHTQFMQNIPEFANKDGDAALNAIIAGYVRVVIKPDAVWLTARDMTQLRFATKTLLRSKWIEPDVELTVDIVDIENPQSFRAGSAKHFIRTNQ